MRWARTARKGAAEGGGRRARGGGVASAANLLGQRQLRELRGEHELVGADLGGAAPRHRAQVVLQLSALAVVVQPDLRLAHLQAEEGAGGERGRCGAD